MFFAIIEGEQPIFIRNVLKQVIIEYFSIFRSAPVNIEYIS